MSTRLLPEWKAPESLLPYVLGQVGLADPVGRGFWSWSVLKRCAFFVLVLLACAVVLVVSATFGPLVSLSGPIQVVQSYLSAGALVLDMICSAAGIIGRSVLGNPLLALIALSVLLCTAVSWFGTMWGFYYLLVRQQRGVLV